jgi:hypothetical protein
VTPPPMGTRRHLIDVIYIILIPMVIVLSIWYTNRVSANENESRTAEVCWSRVKSTAELDAVNKAGVAHAKDTALTLNAIVAALNGLPDSPRLQAIRDAVQKYQGSVAAYEAAANKFVPQDPAKCPPMPEEARRLTQCSTSCPTPCRCPAPTPPRSSSPRRSC